MTVIIAALHLPFTVSFGIDRTDEPARPVPPQVSRHIPSDATAIPSMMGLLSSMTHPTPPSTPPPSAEVVDFFKQKLPADIGKDTDRRRLVQPRSRASSPPASELVAPRTSAPPPMAANTRGRRRSSIVDANRYATAAWTIEPQAQGNGGLRNAVMAASSSGELAEKIWIGTLGMPTDSLSARRKEEISRSLREKYNCLPVYVADNDLEGHYNQYCKHILWPTFHYQIPDNPKNKAYEDHSWCYYVALNRAVADAIVDTYEEGDTVWIHDYHLLLVPAMVRERLPHATIGFFLHVAFPSSEVFRCLAVRRQLLEGVLGANVIGFQTHDYARHFLQTCNRILGVEATPQGIYLEERFVRVVENPIGIDPDYLRSRIAQVEVQEWTRLLADKYAGKRVLVARDKFDHVRGIPQKLLAFEHFLKQHPDMQDVVLIQVALSTAEHMEFQASVADLVTRINSNHTLGHQPLVFLHQDISFAQYLALLTVAESLVVTSLREGMNLTSHEFVFCQQEKHGVLVLSEFTGTASLLEDAALLVNPWDASKTAAAIYQALTMPEEEKKGRWQKMFDRVIHHTAAHWLHSSLQTLSDHAAAEAHREAKQIPKLTIDGHIGETYKAASRRLFILDYEGTLATWGSTASIIVTSPQKVINVLNDLTSDPRNVVYVASGITPIEMERLFRRVPNLGLIAENGCLIRFHGESQFHNLADQASLQWKSTVKQILAYYQERTSDTVVEEKNCSFIFHYEDADDQAHAAWQAGECANHVNEACESLHVHAVPMDGAVLVENLDYSKAGAASKVLEHMGKHGGEDAGDEKDARLPDFIFTAGNDRTDEKVFAWANEQPGTIVSVAVGDRQLDAANYMVQGVTGLIASLQLLSKSGGPLRRNTLFRS